jgi:hypothetical protein
MAVAMPATTMNAAAEPNEAAEKPAASGPMRIPAAPALLLSPNTVPFISSGASRPKRVATAGFRTPFQSPKRTARTTNRPRLGAIARPRSVRTRTPAPETKTHR